MGPQKPQVVGSGPEAGTDQRPSHGLWVIMGFVSRHTLVGAGGEAGYRGTVFADGQFA